MFRSRLRVVLLLVVAGCDPRPPRTVAPDTPEHASPSASPPDDDAALEPAVAAMKDECAPVVAESGEVPKVDVRRVDLGGDARKEAIVHVGCADVSQWKIFAVRKDGTDVLFERIDAGATIEVAQGPDDKPLVVIEHDCCCIYQLEIHALEGGALVKRFAWESGCAPGCDTGMGYQASVDVDPDGTLRGITVPKGECGVDGNADIDLRTWSAAE